MEFKENGHLIDCLMPLTPSTRPKGGFLFGATMDFLYSAASIWTIVVWIIGAITITGFLILALMRLYRAISNRLWVRSAMQALEKDAEQ